MRWLRGIVGLGMLLSLGCTPGPSYKYRFVVIPKGLTHEHWQSVHRGALRAAADLEPAVGGPIDIIWDGPLRERDALAQIRIIDRRIAYRVDGIVLAPQHSKTMVAPVERAVEQNIPVVVIDSGLDLEALERFRQAHSKHLIVKYVATNNKYGGYLAGDRLLQVIDPKQERELQLIMLRYAPGSESTEQREAGFEQRIDEENADRAKSGKPSIRWLDKDHYAGATKDSAIREALPLLQRLASERIDGIFAPNESSASGVLTSLDTLGRSVPIVGFDASPTLIQALDENKVQGLILQDPYRMGYASVWHLVQHLQNKTPALGDFQSTGEYVVTRDETDPGRRRYPLQEARRWFDKEVQAQRSSAELLQP